MPSVTIELTEKEYRDLTKSADREGWALEELMKARALSERDEDMQALADFLAPRIREAAEGKAVEIPVGGLSDHVRRLAARRDE